MQVHTSFEANTYAMVMKQYDAVDIECWEHIAKRRFGVTRPPFICLKAGPEACGVMLMLLDELAGLQPPSQRVMTLKPSHRPTGYSKIRFVVSPISDDLTEMSLTRNSEIADFEFTHIGIKRFREAVVSWQNGQEDFCVYPSQYNVGIKDRQSGEVWFWSLFTDP